MDSDVKKEGKEGELGGQLDRRSTGREVRVKKRNIAGNEGSKGDGGKRQRRKERGNKESVKISKEGK